MDRSDCNECIHGSVCKYKVDVMQTLKEELERPFSCFGEPGNSVASISKDVWVECNYFNRGTTEELTICI